MYIVKSIIFFTNATISARLSFYLTPPLIRSLGPLGSTFGKLPGEMMLIFETKLVCYFN